MQINNTQTYKLNSPTFRAQLNLKDAQKIIKEEEFAILNNVAAQIGDENDSIFIGCQRFVNETKSAHNVEAFVAVTIQGKTERGIITRETTETGETLSKSFCKELINLLATINRDLKKQHIENQEKTDNKSFLNKLIDIFK